MGLEGPRLKLFIERLAQTPNPALDWLTHAGVALSAVKELLGQGRYKPLVMQHERHAGGLSFRPF